MHDNPTETPPTTKVTHCGFQRYQQKRIQIYHIISNNAPTDTQYCINILCYNMIAETLTRIATITKKSSVKAWDLVFIPYNDGVDGATVIPATTNIILSKDIDKGELEL